MNVFIIPEDFRKDQYILKPIISRMMQEIGKPRAKVRVCQDPLLGGIGEALKWERIEEIVEDRKAMVDLFLLCVDRDGNTGRRNALDRLEGKAQACLPPNSYFLAENAWEEVEIWVLAGHDLPRNWQWNAIRAEVDLKETYFEPFATQRGLADTPGGGRKLLAEEAVHHYTRIRQRCPEDIAVLEQRIQGLDGRMK